jgi:serine/threonine protein kinase
LWFEYFLKTQTLSTGSLDKIIDFYYKNYKETLPEVYISKITKKILKGLDYLHNERHTVHRDLKPQNILVNSQGQIKVCNLNCELKLRLLILDLQGFIKVKK